MLNILFMGTPDFAEKSLEKIYNKGHKILGVVTNPDRPKGRGMKMVASPVKEFAIKNNIPVYQPEKVRNNEEFITEIKKLNPDVICVVAYGKILPKELLEIPKLGCINVHGSLLPKYRGAAPIQWAVLNGDEVTGITTMYMDEGMDTGDMILKQEVKINENETTGELWERLAEIGGELLVETLEKIETKTAPREKQGEDFSLAPMLDKAIARINWEEKTAKEIKNLVRGLNPIMGAYGILNGKKLKLWKVDLVETEDFMNNHEEFKEYAKRFEDVEAGTIIYINEKEGLYIKAKDAIISVIELQAENSKRMQIQEFLRGNKLSIGDSL